MSEVITMSKYLYTIENGKKTYYRKPDLNNVDEKTACMYYDAIVNSEPSSEIEKRLRKEIAEEDAYLRTLKRKGVSV